jgi:translation elongation factor EF-G
VVQRKPRLVEPMHLCEFTTDTEQLGAVSGVLVTVEQGAERRYARRNFVVYGAYITKSQVQAVCFLLFVTVKLLLKDPFSVLKTQEIEEFADDSILLRSS